MDVSRLGLGAIVDRIEVGEAVDQVASLLTHDAILGWRAAMKDVPVSLYQYTDEFDVLAHKLRASISVD
jgi:hypothetical protein